MSRNQMSCGPNDTKDENVGNATSDIDEDSGRIEEGWSYSEKLDIDLDEIKDDPRLAQEPENDDDEVERTGIDPVEPEPGQDELGTDIVC